MSLGRNLLQLGFKGVILNYHCIRAKDLRQHLNFYRQHFDFFSHNQLIGAIKDSTFQNAKPFLVFTFDDGKLSHYQEVAPILEEYGIKGVFYLVTQFTSGKICRLWFDRARMLRIQHKNDPQLSPSRLKQLKLRELEEVLARYENTELEHQFENDPDILPMTWAQADDLIRRGHTIGSHGATHQIMTNESFEDAASDMLESYTTIKEKLGLCNTFCFPNGNFSKELIATAQSIGFQSVMTTEPRWITRSIGLESLPRIQIHGYPLKFSIQKWKLAAALLPGVLTDPNGTHRSYALKSIKESRRRFRLFEDAD